LYPYPRTGNLWLLPASSDKKLITQLEQKGFNQKRFNLAMRDFINAKKLDFLLID